MVAEESERTEVAEMTMTEELGCWGHAVCAEEGQQDTGLKKDLRCVQMFSSSQILSLCFTETGVLNSSFDFLGRCVGFESTLDSSCKSVVASPCATRFPQSFSTLGPAPPRGKRHWARRLRLLLCLRRGRYIRRLPGFEHF